MGTEYECGCRSSADTWYLCILHQNNIVIDNEKVKILKKMLKEAKQ